MKVELTENMIKAINVAFDELDNTDLWSDYLDDDEITQVHTGKEELEKLISKYKDN